MTIFSKTAVILVHGASSFIMVGINLEIASENGFKDEQDVKDERY